MKLEPDKNFAKRMKKLSEVSNIKIRKEMAERQKESSIMAIPPILAQVEKYARDGNFSVCTYLGGDCDINLIRKLLEENYGLHCSTSPVEPARYIQITWGEVVPL